MKPTPSSTTAKLDPDPGSVEPYEKGKAVVLTRCSVIPREPT